MGSYFLDVFGDRGGAWAFVLVDRNSGEKTSQTGFGEQNTSLETAVARGLSSVSAGSDIILRTQKSLPRKMREQFTSLNVIVFPQESFMEYSECKQKAVSTQNGMDWLNNLQRNTSPSQPPKPPLSKTARRKQKHERRMFRKYGALNNKKHTT